MAKLPSLLITAFVSKKKNISQPLTGTALIKETCRRIRVARSYWDAHNNRACRGEREKALTLYEGLTKEEREKVPQVLRVWLRYRSEKYFGDKGKRAGKTTADFLREEQKALKPGQPGLFDDMAGS